jgi:hypothetical protein
MRHKSRSLYGGGGDESDISLGDSKEGASGQLSGCRRGKGAELERVPRVRFFGGLVLFLDCQEVSEIDKRAPLARRPLLGLDGLDALFEFRLGFRPGEMGHEANADPVCEGVGRTQSAISTRWVLCRPPLADSGVDPPALRLNPDRI